MPGEFTRVYSAALRGVDAVEVELEVNETSPSNSGGEMQALTVIVGLPDTAVKESRGPGLDGHRQLRPPGHPWRPDDGQPCPRRLGNGKTE